MRKGIFMAKLGGKSRANFGRQCLYMMVAAGLLSGISLAGTGPATAQDRIAVATVNGETIWFDDVMEQAERLPAEYRQMPLENYFGQLVTDMVDARLAATTARAEKFDTKETVATAMKQAADRVLAEAWISNAVGDEIDEAAIQKAYQTFAADTASREQVAASHILVATEEEAKAIIKEIQDGADFAETAKGKSTGPSGPNGGSLGTFGRGQMVPAFENAAFALNNGDISATPVQTQFGWHVIKVDEKSTAPAPALEQMRDQLVQNLSGQAVGRVLGELRARQDINIRSFEDVREEALATTQKAQ